LLAGGDNGNVMMKQAMQAHVVVGTVGSVVRMVKNKKISLDKYRNNQINTYRSC
jgi:superfamily II DNA/RNA helicase